MSFSHSETKCEVNIIEGRLTKQARLEKLMFLLSSFCFFSNVLTSVSGFAFILESFIVSFAHGDYAA